MIQREDTYISTLRVRGARRKSVALQQRLAHLLGTVPLRPAGISPSTILFVRHLTVPLPGGLSPYRHDLRADPAWGAAARRIIAEQYRGAARPVRGIIAGNAEAVLFADEAEMLACLALALRRGVAGSQWWWRTVLRRVPTLSLPDRLCRLMCERAPFVPATWHYLATWRQAGSVLHALPPPQARKVLDAVCAAHHIPMPDWTPRGEASLGEGSPFAVASSNSGEDPSALQLSTGQPELRVNRRRIPPWDRLLAPSFVTELGREQEALLGISLMLFQAPRKVQDTAFQAALQKWWLSPSTGWSGPGSVAEPRDDVSVTPTNPAREAERERARPSHRATAGTRARSASDGGVESEIPLRQSAPGNERAPAASTTRSPQNERSEDPVPPTGPSISVNDRATSEAADQEGSPLDASLPVAEELAFGVPADRVVDTQLGGVLYLVNLMTHLDLPDCFEASMRLRSTVGAWGVLDVLARGLASVSPDDLSQEPLWSVLAMLDGRHAATPLGADFEGADSFRLPKRWMSGTMRPARYFWAARRGQMRLWTPHFPVAECPVGGDRLAAEARLVLEGYDLEEDTLTLSRKPFDGAPLAEVDGPLLSQLNQPLRHWLALVLPYVQYRLSIALGLDPSDASGLFRILLRTDGRMYVTASHVDLVMPLNAVSLPVRMAGLDRDPGWIPAFGRVVQFHFEGATQYAGNSGGGTG